MTPALPKEVNPWYRHMFNIAFRIFSLLYDFMKYICLADDCLTQRLGKPEKNAGDSVTASFVIRDSDRRQAIK